jgi:hypothetical protein
VGGGPVKLWSYPDGDPRTSAPVEPAVTISA